MKIDFNFLPSIQIKDHRYIIDNLLYILGGALTGFIMHLLVIDWQRIISFGSLHFMPLPDRHIDSDPLKSPHPHLVVDLSFINYSQILLFCYYCF
jgi:hypothetical protein